MYFSSSILLRRSTSGYPGSSGGTSVYTGTGSSKTANATSYKDITGLSANTTYYFTCTSVANPLPNGSSYNVSAKTKEVEIQTFLQSFINNGCCQVAGFNCRNYNYLTAVKIAWSGHNNYQSQFTSSGNNIYIDADGWDNSRFRFRDLSSFWGTNYSSENSGLYIKVNNTASTTVEASVTTLCNNIKNNFNYVSIRGTGYDENPNTAESYGDIKILGVESFGIQNTGRITTVSWTTSGKYIRTSDMVGQWIVIGFDIGYSHGTDGYLNNIQNGLFVFKKK